MSYFTFQKFTPIFLSIVILLPVKIFPQSLTPGNLEVLGLGGAGGMYTPASSPVDSELLFVSCDMSGSYRSIDGGESWSMIHSSELRSSRSCRPMFAGDTIYWIAEGQLRMSTDKGKSWKPLINGNAPWGNNTVIRLAHIRINPSTLFVGAGNTVYVSENGGLNWRTGKQGDGDVSGLAVMGSTVYATTGKQLWVSTDGGDQWDTVTVPEADGNAFTSLTAGADGENQVVYAVADNIGLLRSIDGGENWETVLTQGDVSPKGTEVASALIDIVMPGNQVNAAYVNNRNQIFKTENGGKTWESVFRMDSYSNPGQSTLPFNVEKSWVQTELKWGYYITELGLGVNPADPDIALVSTQGDLYKTEDGGESWQQMMNEKVGTNPDRYRSVGLEVTSSWEFLFDPFDTSRYYIAYTDIGFARSTDKGNTWIHAADGSGKWSNTFYNVVFDPEIKGRMYAAASNRHDIPHWTHINSNSPQHEGGVIMSSNHGASWNAISNGLPHVPCTWVALDPNSPKEERTLYAAMYEDGIYKSIDNGKNWVKKSNGLGNAGNMHVLQVQINSKTGNLFASITAHRNNSQFPVPGGLWKSTDGGENWSDLTAELDLRWATYFALNPDNPDIIYLSAATAPGFPQGGLYKTTDGGETWERILSDADFAKKSPPSYEQSMQVKLHPQNPDIVYLGSSHGLWVSTDAGDSWNWFNGIPFKSAQNVAFDPKNPKIMYVNTFGGGVWRGYYLPEGVNEPGVVFQSGFEEGNKDIWDDYDNNPDSENQLIENPGPFNTEGNHVLRLSAPSGERGGADVIKVLPSQHDSLYVCWYIKYETGFNFDAKNHGAGLFAGDRNNLGRSDYRPDGDDFAISLLEYNTTLHTPNIYTYYRGMYQDCADPDGQCWGDVFPCTSDDGKTYCTKTEDREPPLPPELTDDRWYCMEMKWNLGTPSVDGSISDGEISLWVDGVNYGQWDDLWIRTTDDLKITILWLSLFHHDGTHSDAGILMDNVVVSTKRIGCVPATNTKISSFSKGNIKIFPNPAQHVVNIRLAETMNFSVGLYDISGRLMLTKSFSGNSGKLNLEKLRSGIYLLTVKDNKGQLLSSTAKIIRN